MIQKLKENIDILLIILVGFILRLITAVTHAFTNDELSAIHRLRFSSFSDLIEFGVKKGDMHPAGVQVFEKIWASLFGISEFSVRFPFVIFGTWAIYLTFKIGSKWLNRQTGIWAALFLSLLYFPVIQSELARPYAVGLFISTFVAHYLLKILLDENAKWRDSLLLGIGFAAAMYTHYFLFLTIIFIGFTSLIFLNKSNFKFIFSSALIAIILFTPHIPITIYHLQVGGLGWLGKPENDFLIQFLFHLANEDFVLISLCLTLITLPIFYKSTFETKNSKVLLLMFVWPIGVYILGHILSIFSTPLLKFPVFIFITPFILIGIGYLFKSNPKNQFLLAITGLYIMFSTIMKNELFDIKHQGFKKTSELIISWNKIYGRSDIFSVYNINDEHYINYYANQTGDTIDFNIDEINYGDENKIRNELSTRKENYCIVGFAEKNTVLQIFEIAQEFYPFIVAQHLFDNSTVYLLSKNSKDLKITPQKKQLAQFNAARSNEKSWIYNSDQIKKTSNNYFFYELKDETIYGPEFVFQPQDVFNRFTKKYFKVNAEVISTKNAQLTITVSAEKNGELIKDLNGENFWMGFDVDNMIACNTDSTACSNNCYFAFELPHFIPKDANVKISFWNRSAIPVGIKSVQIEFKENKWN